MPGGCINISPLGAGCVNDKSITSNAISYFIAMFEQPGADTKLYVVDIHGL